MFDGQTIPVTMEPEIGLIIYKHKATFTCQKRYKDINMTDKVQVMRVAGCSYYSHN